MNAINEFDVHAGYGGRKNQQERAMNHGTLQLYNYSEINESFK
jgi:hypothetical protein